MMQRVRTQQEGVEVDSRSDDEIAARVSEIDRRQSTRRVGPIFSTAGSFPWEYVVVAVAGAILLLSAYALRPRHHPTRRPQQRLTGRLHGAEASAPQ